MKYACDLLGITYPIIQGGMGNISNAPLTSAVSEAGGLGTVGAGTMPPDEVEKLILDIKSKTTKPFSLNIPISVTKYTNELIDLAIKHRIAAVSLSAGNPAPFIPILQRNDIKAIVIVASVKHAIKAEEAGADVLVAEGFEAAGINSSLELTTFSLIPQIVDKVGIPVFAAGGIADGRGLAAALMLGASGVQMGTRFVAVREAPFHKAYKEKVLHSDDLGTIILGRSLGRVRRVLKGDYAASLIDSEKKGMTEEEFLEKTSEQFHVKGAIQGDFEKGYVNGGQAAGLIQHIPSVKQLFEEMMEQTQNQIKCVYKQFQ
ncbi:enoyl-ACP reductase II [Siminovitchia terrae]|uniref:NAD(P)H-dependent flavin oxidoreductase n=1 Tax=Siminovitchia terrae TaxID=1914933 RepID=UPI001B0ACEF0|nr:nitronate monooxygenase [Siminovitchia terrae]GIN91941.1 enoyl-ACP reductase II [Siminovitchia terrae]